MIHGSLPNSPLPIGAEYFKYDPNLDPILDPIFPRYMHVCFAWIDYFNPVSWQNNLYYLAHFIQFINTVKSHCLLFHIYAVFSTEVVLLLHIYAVFSTEVVLLNHIYTGILRYCGSVTSRIYTGIPILW